MWGKLGRLDSNQRMAAPKAAALGPLATPHCRAIIAQPRAAGQDRAAWGEILEPLRRRGRREELTPSFLCAFRVSAAICCPRNEIHPSVGRAQILPDERGRALLRPVSTLLARLQASRNAASRRASSTGSRRDPPYSAPSRLRANARHGVVEQLRRVSRPWPPPARHVRVPGRSSSPSAPKARMASTSRSVSAINSSRRRNARSGSRVMPGCRATPSRSHPGPSPRSRSHQRWPRDWPRWPTTDDVQAQRHLQHDALRQCARARRNHQMAGRCAPRQMRKSSATKRSLSATIARARAKSIALESCGGLWNM